MKRIDASVSRKMDIFLEEIYPESQKAGEEMAGLKFGKSQTRGFESLLTSTGRFSEILNYIKKQAGKDKKKEAWVQVAPTLLAQLEILETKAMELGNGDPSFTLQIKIKLAREWGKQVISHYMYQQMRMGE